MIFGPPGSGKSCTIKIVSNKLVERGGTVFFASGHPGSVSSFLTDFCRVEPDRKCIVILEDIDSLIHNFGEAAYLEMLDSAKTINNVLFIATTNYPELLDARIYNRPGRFSHVIKIGLPGEAARRAYLQAILKNHRDVEEIVESSDGFTIDHITALINAVYREKKDLKTEIKRLRTLFKVPKADEKRQIGIGVDE
jgi:SpoVK/Ycf46/Vps4 family AAA+-type ATPase